MMYACPKCGKRTKSPHSPRLHKEGGLLRRRECTACPNKFETLEVERGAVDRIVLRKFKKEFGSELAELRKAISALTGR